MDIDTDEDDLVYFNVNWSSAGTGDYLKGYLYDVSPECDEEDPAGYEVFVEVWAYDSPNGWRKLGFINYDHLTVSPVLDPGAWFDPGEYLGKTEDYTHYTNCFTGPHLHQDHYNYEHFAKWTDKAWNGETLYQTTAIGFLGGTGDTGPDGHGGSWVGW
jgi:hypothetical protein